MYTEDQLLNLEAEGFRYSNPELYRHIYNKALKECLDIIKNSYRMDAIEKIEKRLKEQGEAND